MQYTSKVNTTQDLQCSLLLLGTDHSKGLDTTFTPSISSQDRTPQTAELTCFADIKPTLTTWLQPARNLVVWRGDKSTSLTGARGFVANAVDGGWVSRSSGFKSSTTSISSPATWRGL